MLCCHDHCSSSKTGPHSKQAPSSSDVTTSIGVIWFTVIHCAIEKMIEKSKRYGPPILLYNPKFFVAKSLQLLGLLETHIVHA